MLQEYGLQGFLFNIVRRETPARIAVGDDLVDGVEEEDSEGQEEKRAQTLFVGDGSRIDQVQTFFGHHVFVVESEQRIYKKKMLV